MARVTPQKMQRSLLKDLKVVQRMLPKSWYLIDENNTLHLDLYRGKWIPKTCNALFIPVYFMNRTPEEDPLRMGESHGPMRFDDGFAVKELFIYPHKKDHSEMGHSMMGTIIHELALIIQSEGFTLSLELSASQRQFVSGKQSCFLTQIIEKAPLSFFVSLAYGYKFTLF